MTRAVANLRAVRGSQAELAGIRLAAEGIPIGAIARALLRSAKDIRRACAEAVNLGHLKALPPDDWPEASRPSRRRPVTAAALSTRDVVPTAIRARMMLGLPYGESMMLAALVIAGEAEKGALRRLVARSKGDTTVKLVDVVACHLRRTLRPHGIAIETVWGLGLRMTPADRDKVRGLLDLRDAA